MYQDGSFKIKTKRHLHFGMVKSWTILLQTSSRYNYNLCGKHHLFHYIDEKAKAHKS